MSRIYRCTVKAHFSSGILVEPSVHYQTDLSLGGDEPDPDDVATGIWDHIGSAWLNTAASGLHFDELIVAEQVVPPALGAAGSHTIDTGGTSSLTSGDDMPTGIVAIVNVHTNTRSRNSRGHFCLSPPAVSGVHAAQGWTSGYTTAVNSLCALLDDVITIGSIITTDLRPVVYSRTRHLNNTAPWTFPVSSATLNPTCHWLRSRMTSP